MRGQADKGHWKAVASNPVWTGAAVSHLKVPREPPPTTLPTKPKCFKEAVSSIDKN